MSTVSANATPTKEFFINMLTRDIETNDAILDLLDNCLDGVVRSKGADGKKADSSYYKGYSASITIAPDCFSISDNCGGIPRKVAEENAFRMGRASATGEDLPTVGIYGIGMKRAIFKIGRSAKVVTRHRDDSYAVIIGKDWADNPNDWKFPIENIAAESVPCCGTTVEISDLKQNIAALWSNKDQMDTFINALVSSIISSYSLIIEKGFQISINGNVIAPKPVQLLISTEEKGLKPYIFTNSYGDVQVQLAIGFYIPPPSDDEIDERNESRRRSADAGWTVVCNDRVVLYNDKSHLTGWGEAGVPHYHTQFIGICGIVLFESNNPENLPMTTTKRGIDLSSSIYADVKNKMREGLKLFTNYTNQWKGQNALERERYSSKAESVSYVPLFSSNRDAYGISMKNTSSGSIFKPELPKPPNDKKYTIIRFSKPNDDIEKLTQYFCNDSSIPVKPSVIGEKCFDKVMQIACGESPKEGDVQ